MITALVSTLLLSPTASAAPAAVYAGPSMEVMAPVRDSPTTLVAVAAEARVLPEVLPGWQLSAWSVVGGARYAGDGHFDGITTRIGATAGPAWGPSAWLQVGPSLDLQGLGTAKFTGTAQLSTRVAIPTGGATAITLDGRPGWFLSGIGESDLPVMDTFTFEGAYELHGDGMLSHLGYRNVMNGQSRLHGIFVRVQYGSKTLPGGGGTSGTGSLRHGHCP